MADISRSERITRTLQDALAPSALEVQDDSRRHAGHAGASAAGETHFNLRVVSEKFSGLNRVGRSRLVHQILQQEFETGLHALSMELRSPDDFLSKNPG
jgi:BolA protein